MVEPMMAGDTTVVVAIKLLMPHGTMVVKPMVTTTVMHHKERVC
jgi:hypothetical protein